MTQAAPDLAKILEKLSDIGGKIDALAKTVGEESEDGKSGTGLVGEVRRQGQDLKSLTSLRDKGLGAVGAVMFALSILGISFRQSIGAVLFGGHK